MTISDVYVSLWWSLIPLFIVLALAWRWVMVLLSGARIIPNGSIGIVRKKWAVKGVRQLPDGQIVALKGEPGIQADTLPPGGPYWGLWPWQFEVSEQPFVTIDTGQIGIVEARDGKSLPAGRVLAKNVDCESFQNARAFLERGGERGAQLTIIPPGTYRINTALFTVRVADQLEVPPDAVGIVTTKEGGPLAEGQIAGAVVDGHGAFQDAQAFINGGGAKGLQEQVILSGRYFINPLFASVQLAQMTIVPIANVGVVISYVGPEGKDVSGDTFKHGNLCIKGERGVWSEPLDPGKYAINPHTHKVELVPTANVVLNWATGKTEAHNLDKNLSTITVRSSDGYTFNLDVSQIIHIPRSDAPKVIARFGNILNLVTQVLEPTIGNYFRNAAQRSDVIDFLKSRSDRQDDAKKQIAKALDEYNVNAVDTLIGDIAPPAELMKTLTDRKLAEQQQITYQTQKAAAAERQELNKAQALADTQAEVVGAERRIVIAESTASAAVKTAEGAKRASILQAEGEAQATTARGRAEAEVTTLVGDAEASKTLAIGNAEADVIQNKIKSMDAGNYAGVEIARALAASGKPLVPEIVAGGNGDASSGIVQVLVASMLKDRATRA